MHVVERLVERIGYTADEENELIIMVEQVE